MSGRRSFRGACFCAVLLAAAFAGFAQELPQSLEPMRHGPITVWIVAPAQPPRPQILSNYAITPPTPLTYHEQTSGSFGQSASTFGQNSGSYGLPSDTPAISTPKAAQGENAPPPGANGVGYRQQTSGSFGQTASTFGINASDHGQTAGSFGQTASTAGTNASNHGVDAGNFGNSLGTIAGAGTRAPAPLYSSLYTGLSASLRAAFPDIQVKYVDVPANELKDRLTALEGSGDYPDVLVGALPSDWGLELRAHFVFEGIQPAERYSDGLGSRADAITVSVLARARHRQAARALALWADEAFTGCTGCVQNDEVRKLPYVAVAIAAVDRMVQGVPLGELGHPDMAAFPSALGRLMLTTTSDRVADDGTAHVEVVNATQNGRLAAVSVRVVASGDELFGTAHPLVVLRQAKNGPWKVLHVSLNVPGAEQERVRAALMSTAPSSVAERQAGVVGVKLASPQEGETRPPVPTLSWDNGGGAGLQVVEWQRALGDGWTDARLFLIGDRAPRLKTEARAGFAIYQARYRWRVWSVGAKGEVKLTPWRTMNIQL
jgi:hypothetical protein